MSESKRPPALVVGAGPAGLTAAWELNRLGRQAVVLEQDPIVGGISRTVEYNGYRFDIGGHRFFTKIGRIQELWGEMSNEPLLERPRLSRIYYNGNFFDYPLKPFNALSGLGPIEAFRIGMSYLKARALPESEETNFEQWVCNRFGRRLYEIFFKTYTEKVWGIPCTEIGADWAAQRIKNLDLAAAVKNAFLGARTKDGSVITTLIDRFHYPRHGPGMLWESCLQKLQSAGVETRLVSRVVGLHHDGERVLSAIVESDGETVEIEADDFISSMPLRTLLRSLEPEPPAQVREAADRLRYRDFLTVVLIVDRADVFPDNWIYIHSPEVRLGRIQNYKNWSPDMVADQATTSLGLEYFVQIGDELWDAEDADLIEMAEREVVSLGLIEGGEVVDATVVRMPKAYPVYDHQYAEALATIRPYLESLSNLQTIGRNGQHRYNNQDHSMLTGVWAAQNVDGASHDVWSANVEQEYHEEVRSSSDRLVPKPLQEDLDALLRRTFATYDPIALGSAVGVVSAAAIFVATAVLLLKGGEPVGPNLSLLGQYLLGFSASWPGAFIGALEAGILGFALGALLASGFNRLVRFSERSLLRELELARTLDPLSRGPS